MEQKRIKYKRIKCMQNKQDALLGVKEISNLSNDEFKRLLRKFADDDLNYWNNQRNRKFSNITKGFWWQRKFFWKKKLLSKVIIIIFSPYSSVTFGMMLLRKSNNNIYNYNLIRWFEQRWHKWFETKDWVS